MTARAGPGLPDLGTRLVRASALVRDHAGARGGDDGEPWPPPGHVFELTGDLAAAPTSAAVAAVTAVQATGGIVAWMQPRDGTLFPPDLAANGVDLDALVVVHLPPAAGAATRRPPRGAAPGPAPGAAPGSAPGAAPAALHQLPKAAELLLRSGAFDLLVLDLRPVPPPRGAWLGRLQALAREHRARVLLLTDERAPIEFATGLAQRIAPLRRRDGGTFVIEPQLRRDKLHAAVLPPALLRSGPAGLS